MKKPSAPAPLRDGEFDLPDVGKVKIRALPLSAWLRITSSDGDSNERTVQMLAACVLWEGVPLWTTDEWERYGADPDKLSACRELCVAIYGLSAPKKKSSAQTSDSP